MTLRLSKLHGLGNDFLVHLTDDAADAAASTDWSSRARRWCDRRTGVGADGLIVGVRHGRDVDLVMHLFNADGSRAEMSGNGIRCLAHAEAIRRGERKVHLAIATDGGIRSVDLEPVDGQPLAAVAAVDMGAGRPGPPLVAAADVLEPKRAGTYDFGNPHLVLLVDDPALVDLAAVGAGHERAYAGGINVHVIAPTPGEDDALTMRVWERGVGVTEACGTGAAAVAVAAYDWDLVGDRVTVHMPGGDVRVDVGDTVVLHGRSDFVADVEVPA